MSATEPIRMLGRYELLRRIAKGGMGEIYLARTRGMAGFEKNCIIKTILPHLAEEEEFVTKFLDEGRIVVQLVHGNIVPVFDMGDEDGEVYMAMEYIPGRDLREVTKRLAARGETMPVDLALFVVSEVCKGLDYAHRKTAESGESLGIVHRDVSPSNVLISREGEIKLIDFGIARAAGRLGKTVSGRIQGKFCYMSPEQAAGKPLDGRSDTFSAGLVLYELLTGFRPFEGGTDLESLDLVRQCEFDPPGALNLEVPDEIDEIIGLALAKDPSDRYPSIDKFQIALMQYLYSSGSSPTSSDLAAFLGDLFPDGLEREELKSARDSSGSPAKKMSLDEALDFELGKLGGASPETNIDPHETTAISSDEARLKSKPSTQTRAPQTPPATEVGPSGSLSIDAPVTDVAQAPKRSWVAWVVIAALLLAAGGGFAVMSSTKGKRTIDSDPPGAQISVDGALIPGAVTPHTLTLDEGRHLVTLEREGFEARTVEVEVEAGTTATVATTVLQPETADEGPKMFTLHSSPDGAAFWLGDAELGQPVVTVKPGEVVSIKAVHDGCNPMIKQIDYSMGNSGVVFDLDCSPEPADAGGTEAVTERTITIKSDPAGATITINGKVLGEAPVKWTGPANASLKITAKKDDLVLQQHTTADRIRRDTLNLRLTPRAAPPGCLTMSIINPMVAEWFIDGERLGQGRFFKNHTLPAGKHKVRVVNSSVDLDHERSVTVPAGDKCALLTLDGSTLK